MKCPHCKSLKLKTKDVRWHDFFGGVRRRKRECDQCGYEEETEEKKITTGRLNENTGIA